MNGKKIFTKIYQEKLTLQESITFEMSAPYMLK